MNNRSRKSRVFYLPSSVVDGELSSLMNGRGKEININYLDNIIYSTANVRLGQEAKDIAWETCGAHCNLPKYNWKP